MLAQHVRADYQNAIWTSFQMALTGASVPGHTAQSLRRYRHDTRYQHDANQVLRTGGMRKIRSEPDV